MWIPLGLFTGFLIFWLVKNTKPKTATPSTSSGTQPQPQPAVGATPAVPAQAAGSQGANNPPATAPAPAQQSLGQKVAVYLLVVMFVAGIVLALALLGGRPKAVVVETSAPVKTQGEPLYEHEKTIIAQAGPWRKAEDVEWDKVTSHFKVPNPDWRFDTYSLRCQSPGSYALLEHDGKIRTVTFENDQDLEITSPVGRTVKITSLTGEGLTLLLRY